MAKAPDGFTTFRSCPDCGAPLSRLIVGGVGVWQRTILCRKCMKLQRNVPIDVIWELAAEQYGVSREAIRLADETSQTEFEQIALGGPPFDDLPPVTTTARFVLRRRNA